MRLARAALARKLYRVCRELDEAAALLAAKYDEQASKYPCDAGSLQDAADALRGGAKYPRRCNSEHWRRAQIVAGAIFLVWVHAFGRVSAQKLPEDVKGAPFIDEGIRGRTIGAPIRLPADHEGLGFAELANLYPAPSIPEG